MIIVFFHVLYLIGKMVYKNYQCASGRHEETSENVAESPVVPVVANISSKCRTCDDPLEPYDDDDDEIPKAPRFSPPAYIQRYVAVTNVLGDQRFQGKIKKVVDFGCSELAFITYLKHTAGIEEILCVDIDKDTLERHKDKAIPLNADYLQNRKNPLTIHVCEGSVTHRDKMLTNSDAVVAIELIEHLYPETLMDFPYNIFGFIKPLVAIVTTPNADFNVLFPNMKSEFRHWDHKFEWTRLQFEDWSRNIVSRYPEYDVTFEGICAGPSGTEELGCCSQMAIFTRIRTPEFDLAYGIEGLFKIITTQEYPYRIDNRSDEEKILDEATYHIRRFTQNNPECLEEYPVSTLMENLSNFYITIEALREILSNGGWTIIDRNDGPAILCPALSTFSDYDEELDNDDLEDNDVWPDVNSSAVNYDDSFGTWGEDNVEAEYDERWDDDFEIAVPSEVSNDVASSLVLPIVNFPNIEFSLSGSIAEFTNIIETNVWPTVSSFESSNRSSNSAETLESNAESNTVETLCFDDCKNSSVDSEDEETVISSLKSNVETIDRSLSSIKIPNVEETASRSSIISKLSTNGSENDELSSLCSIYLESSRNDEQDDCPRDITNSSFDCTELQRSFENSMEMPKAPTILDCLRSRELTDLRPRFSDVTSNEQSNEPEFTSSPRLKLEKPDEQETDEITKNTNQSSFKSSETPSTETKNTSTKLENEDFSQSSFILEKNLDDARSKRQKTPASLSLRSNITRYTIEPISSLEEPRETTIIKDTIKNTIEQDQHYENTPERLISNLDTNVAQQNSNSSKNDVNLPIAEVKSLATPETLETPPNSWSPEIMDSGYPNTSSMQDITPEYDLSSIAQDRISDVESPSIAEAAIAPRLDFPDQRAIVENGDLANNNRDDEGNNMIAAGEIVNDLDVDLQPLIDVLENDIENENDIYGIENDFPIWLLRILERGNAPVGQPIARQIRDPGERAVGFNVHPGGGDAARMPDLDEGFDGISSENDESEDEANDEEDDDDEEEEEDDDDDDDDDNIEEISMEGSEETIDWSVSGDHC